MSAPSSAAATGSLPQFARPPPGVIVGAQCADSSDQIKGCCANGFLCDRLREVTLADALILLTSSAPRFAGYRLAQRCEKARKHDDMLWVGTRGTYPARVGVQRRGLRAAAES